MWNNCCRIKVHGLCFKATTWGYSNTIALRTDFVQNNIKCPGHKSRYVIVIRFSACSRHALNTTPSPEKWCRTPRKTRHWDRDTTASVDNEMETMRDFGFLQECVSRLKSYGCYSPSTGRHWCFEETYFLPVEGQRAKKFASARRWWKRGTEQVRVVGSIWILMSVKPKEFFRPVEIILSLSRINGQQ